MKDPSNRSLGDHILIIPEKLNLLPGIAQEPINVLLPEVVGTIEPVWPEDAHLKLDSPAPARLIEGVVEGGAVVPLQVVQWSAAELVLNDVEVAAIGPVVPEVNEEEGAAVV